MHLDGMNIAAARGQANMLGSQPIASSSSALRPARYHHKEPSSDGSGVASSGSNSSAATRSRRSSASGSPLVNGRYQLDCLVGKGHFASVFRAVDTERGDVVAVKMLGKEYAEDARAETAILQHLTEANSRGRKKVVRLLDCFRWRTNVCIVMPLLGECLSRRRFGVRKGAVPRASVQLLAKQMAEALTFIHGKCALVHTDLKPDNILLDDSSAPGIGNGWTIADFGNSFFHIEGRDGTSLITTRPYRSPEVITKRGWRHPTDMWSLGCILYEVYVGRPLFDVVRDDQVHIALITSKLGAVPGVKYSTQQPPARTTYLQSRFADDPDFLDLLTGLLVYDPTRRLRAKEMCGHRFANPNAPGASLCYPAAHSRCPADTPCAIVSRPPASADAYRIAG